MPKALIMPKIGMNMEEATITKWLVKPGDFIKKGDIILEAETDKAVQEIMATETGTVFKILVQEGETVPCQTEIALLSSDNEQVRVVQKSSEETTTSNQEKPSEPVITTDEKVTTTTSIQIFEKKRIIASPLAKKIAAENRVDLATLAEEVGNRRIVEKDVREFIKKMEQKAKVNAPVSSNRFVPFNSLRKITATRMHESANTKPRVPLSTTINCENLVTWRKYLAEKKLKVSYNALIIKACAMALRKHPLLNALGREDGIEIVDDINIGIAVKTEDGLYVPVIHNADEMSVVDISQKIETLAQKAREGRLTVDEMSGGTFTITNLGAYGVEEFSPIINPPECLILGIGQMQQRPAVVGDDIIPQWQMKITLCFDHRMTDGVPAAKCLQTIKEYLEQPLMML